MKNAWGNDVQRPRSYTGPKALFMFKADDQPKFFRPGAVPYALTPKGKELLNILQKTGIFEGVQYTEWADQILSFAKSDGLVRICGE